MVFKGKARIDNRILPHEMTKYHPALLVSAGGSAHPKSWLSECSKDTAQNGWPTAHLHGHMDVHGFIQKGWMPLGTPTLWQFE